MINWKLIRNTIGYIAFFVLAYLLWDSECDSKNHNNLPDTVTIYEFRVDTVEKIIERAPLQGQAKAKIVYRDRYINVSNSTGLIQSPDAKSPEQSDSAITYDSSGACFPAPFTAVLDTVQGKDSAHIEYLYPESIFRYSIFHKPDTIITYDTTKTYTHTVSTVVDVPWYTKPAAISGFTLIVAYILSSLTK